ncbi:unnamed protein product [Hymenolepis diminuta]|uniref:Uncharacterized protein n=1 Tax=Hymenolepis diminuta TaxID=6216 RepID=A0A564XY17_HYMDI|nr:unnamed protein product [Hymenolepis diminuta]
MSSDDSNSVHNRLCQKIYHGGIEMAINLADEPSVALYRIQEHIRKTAPRIAEERKRALVFSEKLQDATFDLGNSSDAIAAFPNVQTNLENTLKTLELCMIMHQNAITSAKNGKHKPEIEMGVDVVAFLEDYS